MDLASFQIGLSKPLESPLEALGDRVQQMGGKLFIKKFVKFQYGEKLNLSNTAHQGVVKRLSLLGISPDSVSEIIPQKEGASKPLKSPSQGAQDKDKDKVKVKRKKREPQVMPTLEEIISFCAEAGLPQSDAEATYHKWVSNGFTNNSNPILNWKSTIKGWKASGFFPSQKGQAQLPLQTNTTGEKIIVTGGMSFKVKQ
jgi:hypothetical protein